MKSFVEKQGKTKYLILEFDSTEKIDQVTSGMLSNNNIDGLLSFVINQIDDKLMIKFNVSSMTTVTELLLEYVSRERLIKIMDTIIGLFSEVEDYLIEPESLILDTDKMFFDESTDKLYLITMPIIKKNIGNPTLKAFLKSLICKIKFDPTENCDFIGKMLGYLNSDTPFSLSDFKYLIDEQKNKLSPISIDKSENIQNDDPVFVLKKPQLDNCIEKMTPISSSVLHKIENENIPPSSSVTPGFKLPLDLYADDNDQSNEEKNKKSIFSKLFKESKTKNKTKKKDSDEPDEKKIKIQIYDKFGEITSENKMSPDTVLLNSSKKSHKTFLLRLKNNEKIILEKNIFKIGTDKSAVDYYINDNNAVSRTHADIVEKNGVYFIRDNNSTNHTYLNEHMIKSSSEMKLQNRSRIRLANEEFIFYSV